MENRVNFLNNRDEQISPMGFRQSLLFFGIPAIIMIFGFHFIMPSLISKGIQPFYAYFIGLGIPLFFMLLASIYAFLKEGNERTWETFKKRYRFKKLSLKLLFFTLIAFVIIVLIYGITVRLNMFLLQKGFVPMPDLPGWLNTSKEISIADMDKAFGGLKGNYLALVAFLTFLVFNILGEELWWRGYILPRQELVFGKYTWLVHGLMWTLFHAFKWWDLFSLLPVTLILTYLVWRLKNNTIGIILHLLINGLGLIPIILGILG